MGLAGGATADDAEAEYIRSITEKDIVTGALPISTQLTSICDEISSCGLVNSFLFYLGGNLLAKYAPLLIAVCSNQKKYPDQELRAAASLSLAKFMLVR